MVRLIKERLTGYLNTERLFALSVAKISKVHWEILIWSIKRQESYVNQIYFTRRDGWRNITFGRPLTHETHWIKPIISRDDNIRFYWPKITTERSKNKGTLLAFNDLWSEHKLKSTVLATEKNCANGKFVNSSAWKTTLTAACSEIPVKFIDRYKTRKSEAVGLSWSTVWRIIMVGLYPVDFFAKHYYLGIVPPRFSCATYGWVQSQSPKKFSILCGRGCGGVSICKGKGQ